MGPSSAISPNRKEQGARLDQAAKRFDGFLLASEKLLPQAFGNSRLRLDHQSPAVNIEFGAASMALSKKFGGRGS